MAEPPHPDFTSQLGEAALPERQRPRAEPPSGDLGAQRRLGRSPAHPRRIRCHREPAAPLSRLQLKAWDG